MQAQPFGYTPTRKPLWASLRSKKNHISIINNYIYELKVESRSHSKNGAKPNSRIRRGLKLKNNALFNYQRI